jgi:hypothetical protein
MAKRFCHSERSRGISNFKMNKNLRCFDCAARRFAPLNMTSNE